jgi:hypothetical protein
VMTLHLGPVVNATRDKAEMSQRGEIQSAGGIFRVGAAFV